MTAVDLHERSSPSHVRMNLRVGASWTRRGGQPCGRSCCSCRATFHGSIRRGRGGRTTGMRPSICGISLELGDHGHANYTQAGWSWPRETTLSNAFTGALRACRVVQESLSGAYDGNGRRRYVYLAASADTSASFPFQQVVKVDVATGTASAWQAPAGDLPLSESRLGIALLS